MNSIFVLATFYAVSSGAPYPQKGSSFNAQHFFGGNVNMFSDLNIPGFGTIPGFGQGNSGVENIPQLRGSGIDDIPIIPTGVNSRFESNFGFPSFEESDSFPFEVDEQEFPFQFLPEDYPFQFQEADDSNVDSVGCGLLCSVFEMVAPLQDSLHHQIGDIFTQNKQKQGEYDINNTTYSEKVLDDGTVLKINKTVLSDTNHNGNSFFFHSSVVHNFDESKEDEDKVEGNRDSEIEDVSTEINGIKEKKGEENSLNGNRESDLHSNNQIEETPDPSENEIGEEDIPPTADVRDLFE